LRLVADVVDYRSFSSPINVLTATHAARGGWYERATWSSRPRAPKNWSGSTPIRFRRGLISRSRGKPRGAGATLSN